MKSKKVVALMIGRGGSTLKDKNILPVLGFPLLQWAAGAAHRSGYIGRYYISSDDDKILDTAGNAGYISIERPKELATDTAQSCDAVKHALDVIDGDYPADIVVVQHANVGTISEEIIDSCISRILEDESLTAVVPCHSYDEYHPLRAKTINSSGLLEPYVYTEGKVSANRQELPSCVFFDHSVWILRAEAVRKKQGQGPWECMGDNISPFFTKGCLDVHTLDDIVKTENWIKENNVPFPNFE